MQQDITTSTALPYTTVKGRNEKRADPSTPDYELMNLFNLLKAREPELLRRLLNSCAALLLKDEPAVPGYQAEKERFLVKTGRHLTSVHISQVAFFYCENKTVYLKTKDDRNHILKLSIEEIENTVSPRDFFRISRQIIVSRHSIKKIIIWFNGTLRVDLMPGDHANIIISKLRAPMFRQWLGE
ncbi:LytTR family transcriptional regulator [Paraflavitalea soli]|uniref:LytTR family transcriptional regulator n=1 Tax=Paraflavitalea soli TaxID=2315862 RepID=A0A3B7MG90_9BACT|nr:LytTR family DNA-binding domain-containing protein [Paraflavitalea soli]AXY73362.1 LytTR family transcriptional regulator [Paraflavitalea soli]